MSAQSIIERLHAAGTLRAVDRALADLVQRRHPPADAEVIALTALAAALASRVVIAGHSGIRLSGLPGLLRELSGPAHPSDDADDGMRNEQLLPTAPDWCLALRASPWVSGQRGDTLLHFDGDLLQLARYANYEHRLASALLTRINCTPQELSETAVRAALGRHFDSDNGADLLPLRAARIALSSRLLILSGGPGTGKTHTVLRLLALLIDAGCPLHRIHLAAPTGKAASRLNDSLRDRLPAMDAEGRIAAALAGPATTLHRLLGVRPDGGTPRHHAGNSLQTDLLIVDEVSMVDLPLMTRLLAATPATARLILIGDHDQLSSVEAGDVLAAIDDAAKRADRSAALAGIQVTLRHNYRFGSDSPIARLADAVRDGDVAAARSLTVGHDVIDLHDGPLQGAIVDLQRRAVALHQQVSALSDPEQALRAADDYRILCALRRGPYGAEAINRRIDGRCAAASGLIGQRDYPGRLILIRENQPRIGLHNGDTGVLLRDGRGELRAWFRNADGISRSLPIALLPTHQSAWALSIHQSQGSEFRHVDIVLTEADSPVLGRQLLYTAITRARESLRMLAGDTVFDLCVQRRLSRIGGLRELLSQATPD